MVYSVGLRNSFQFPNPDVVARTRALGATTWRTDEGAVIAESDGATLRMTRF